jgi:hypothetical protein
VRWFATWARVAPSPSSVLILSVISPARWSGWGRAGSPWPWLRPDPPNHNVPSLAPGARLSKIARSCTDLLMILVCLSEEVAAVLGDVPCHGSVVDVLEHIRELVR